jgi:hypothetical protein
MEVKLGRYKHYKGNLYEVICIAKNSETLEDMVVYRGLYNDEKFGSNPIWVRSKEMFLSKKIIDGIEVERFKFLE